MPAPLISNHPDRCTNDPGVHVADPKVFKMMEDFRRSEYPNADPKRNYNDQLILACVIVYVERRVREGLAGRAYFLTEDKKLADRGHNFVVRQGAPLTVLHTPTEPTSKKANDARQLDAVLPK